MFFYRRPPRAVIGHLGLTRPYATINQQRAIPLFDPLRILFCGSDNFSIASLNKLHNISKQESSLIQSIDVVTRPGKWTGPYQKLYKEVPLADQARNLGLPLHQVDTFRGWNPPTDINLIIAVSFGLLIPRRLIDGAKYGGLNVHPSLLPDLWGPAPLQHALLEDDHQMGLTIQTLHPTTMDRGAILAQLSLQMLDQQSKKSFSSITNHMAPLGAELLIDTLRKGLFIPPAVDLTTKAMTSLKGKPPRHARKLTIEDRHINWRTWPAQKIIRYQRLLQKLWNIIDTPKGPIKIVWVGDFGAEQLHHENAAIKPGIPYLSKEDDATLINTIDETSLRIDHCIVAGDKLSSVQYAARKYSLTEDEVDGPSIFKSQLT